jgi:glycosyltransferase involved in cell wall biosynthesis
MATVHAIILTLDEEKHIQRCVESIRGVCASLLVVDSGSKDRTCEIARSLGATVIVSPWVNYATQFNRGISALAGRDGWLLRIDADEYMSERSTLALHTLLDNTPAEISGLLIQRQIVFMGRRIKWGSVEPNWQLRLWRSGRGFCETRWMDEHIVVEGGVRKTGLELVDDNLNSLDWWTSKHNKYASREVIDILSARGMLGATTDLAQHGASHQAKLKRFVKNKIYNRLPGGVRSLAYLLYRYILRLGLLDGRPGYYFHVLQGFWYRTLVDAKLSEIMLLARTASIPIAEAVRIATGIDPLVKTQATAPDMKDRAPPRRFQSRPTTASKGSHAKESRVRL